MNLKMNENLNIFHRKTNTKFFKILEYASIQKKEL